jgi:hypothetical protein
MKGAQVRTKLGRGTIGFAASAGIALALIAGIASACGSSHGTGSAAAAGSSGSPAPIHGKYAPVIDPANFVAGVDNRYFPLEPGTTLRYRGVAEDGKTRQLDEAAVTHAKKTILGVACTVVRDTVSSHGKPVERTYDWYAQDKQGNVWYFGEDSRDFSHGRFVKGGDSWEGGVDGAQPGIIMEGHPKRGDAYRQEYYVKHAEDEAKVLGSGGRVKVPYRSFRHTLATVEQTRLEPNVRERKFYAAGIGEIKSRVAVKGDHEAFQLFSVKR